MQVRSAIVGSAVALVLGAAALASIFWGFPRDGVTSVDSRGAEVRASASVRTVSPDLEIVQQSRAATTAQPISPNTIAIAFPDGSRSLVSARKLSPPRDLPAGRLLDEYETLRNAAESGDGSAAEALYRGLNNCRMAYADEDALDAAIGVLRKERVVKLADGSPATAIESDEDVDVVAESALRDPFDFCKGITTEQKGEAEKWLNVAANQGNLRAMRIRAALLGNTEEAVRAWETAWGTGDRLALEFLGKIHSRGISDARAGRARPCACICL